MSIDLETPSSAAAPKAPLPPTGFRPTSLKYAAIVPICAAGMLAIVIFINIITASPPPSTKVSPKLSNVSGLTPSATNPFTPLVTAGEPPDDILNAVVIPAGAVKVGTPHTGGDATSFDRSLVFKSSASAQAIYTFFHEQLKGRSWRIFSTGAPVGQKGVEMLAQRAGSDGWYWEQGVVVNPTTFSTSGAQSTRFTVRLYQASAAS